MFRIHCIYCTRCYSINILHISLKAPALWIFFIINLIFDFHFSNKNNRKKKHNNRKQIQIKMNLIKIMILILSINMTMGIKRKSYFFKRLQKYPWWRRVWQQHEQRKTTMATEPTISRLPTTLPTNSPTISGPISSTMIPSSPTTLPTNSPTIPGSATTTDNDSNNSNENNIIIKQYRIVQNITRPKLFGFSREEAESFPSRISEIVLPFTRTCNEKSLPKYTGLKTMELKGIFRNDKCTKQRTSQTQSRVSISPSSSENWIGGENRNTDGSVTRLRRCLEKGTLTTNNNLRLCAECQAVTELPENM